MVMKGFGALVALLFVLAACSQASAGTSTPGPAAPSGASVPAAAPSTVAPTRTAPVASKDSAPPLSADTALAGNAQPTYKLGDPNMLAMLDQGPAVNDQSGTASMPIAIRNNTGQAVAHVDIAATASVAGKIVATGDSVDTSPSQIQPGQVALVDISFQTKVPKGATFTYTSEMLPANMSSGNTGNLKVTQANLVGGSIVGSAVNDNTAAITGPYAVSVYCFAGGKLASVHGDYGSVSANLPHGGSTPFSVNLFGTPCAQYEVGVSGFFA